jgi:hypothetical protein
MSRRFTPLFLVIALVTALALPSAAMAARPHYAGTVTAPVTGTFTDALGGVGTFSGDFTPSHASTPSRGHTAITGTLTGTLTDSTGAVVGTVSKTATFDVLAQDPSCQILDLVLGPLNLDLLGLVVHLDTVHLNITAQQGSGNLLGNLLCAVANLLNHGTLGAGLTNLLNQIFGLLGL